MTLALLLTAVTGAWAQSYEAKVVEFDVPADWETDNSQMTAGDLPGFKTVTKDEVNAWDAPAEGEAMFYYAFDGDNASYVFFVDGSPIDDAKTPFKKSSVFANSKHMKIYYTAEPTVPSEPTEWSLTPGSSANTWTFLMPGSDVVLTPIYAKTAAFATTGTEPEVKTLLPEAAEGVIAGTDASLIAEGTGIVAFAGTSAEVKQGTLMYAVGTSATQAPELTEFSATVPTAKTVADDGADVYVWYYIKGADTPQGQQATEDNTFNDTEPACLTVTVLTNKFDIQFNAANANTIEAGKATVTVDGTAATVTDGKLEGVKMGREVKLKAKDGYKFRKVEVKKKEEAPTTVTWNNLNFQGTTYTQDGVTLTPSSGDGAFSNALYDYGENTFTTTLGKFTKIEIVCTGNNLDGWTKETAGKFQPNPDGDPDYWKDLYKMTWTGNAESITLKEKYVYEIQSITFTIQ